MVGGDFDGLPWEGDGGLEGEFDGFAGGVGEGGEREEGVGAARRFAASGLGVAAGGAGVVGGGVRGEGRVGGEEAGGGNAEDGGVLGLNVAGRYIASADSSTMH